MSVEFHIDDKEFQATLKKYLAVTSRTLPEALNQKMFYIVRGAVTRLPKVSKAKIEADVGVSSYELQYTKERTKQPRKKKVNIRRAIKQARKSVVKEFKRDARQFKRNARRFGKSARRAGKRFGRSVRRAFR